jgi:hypothetical protein
MESLRVEDAVIAWLLDPSEPSMRFLASRDLIRPRQGRSSLGDLQAEIPERGWAASLLSRQHERTWWETRSTCYWPKVNGTYWALAVLADLGLTREDERISNAVEHMLRIHLAPDGGFSPFGPPKPSHFCSTGIMVRTLLQLGYIDDHRTREGIGYLLDAQLADRGWACRPPWVSTLDAWEAMAAFAAIPPNRRTSEVHASIERSAEFYLRRRLLREGSAYPRWSQLHYPWHYWYDVLVGLDFLTALGRRSDPRMDGALRILRSKRAADGRWRLEGTNGNLRVEPQGKPSKMITFLCLRILRRLGESRGHRSGSPDRTSAVPMLRLSTRGRVGTKLHIA